MEDGFYAPALYDAIMDFDRMNKEQWNGALVESHRRPWHDAAIEVMLRAQAHFHGEREVLKDMFDDLENSREYRKIENDLSAMQKALQMPAPVCWFEIDTAMEHCRQGFAVEQHENPWRLKLYTFQQRLAGCTSPSRFEGLVEVELLESPPSVIGLQTTMSDYGKEGWFRVEKGAWLDESENAIAIKNMRSVVKMILMVSDHFRGMDLVMADGAPAFRGPLALETDMEKVATKNRQRFYPFYSLSGLWGGPERPASQAQPPQSPKAGLR